jgi:sucrose phosphorylase
MHLQNNIQIISYPDSLGKNLQELHYALNRYFKKAVSGVHILPFFPSSADRGFAPLTYFEVDPSFGTWKDIELLNDEYDLMVDFMVNHISRQSKYFVDFLENGQNSEFADMFLSFSKLSSDGHIREEDLAKVYTRKPRPPFQEIQRPDGSMETIWRTFDFEQIDVDIKSHKTKELFRDFLISLSRKKPLFIRMDAIAYTTVEIGTNCFFLEPEIWDTLEMLNGFVSPFGVSILPEVHAHYSYQLKLAEKGYWVYDFCLPMLVLHTLYHHSNKRLLHWLKICPRHQITTLDTHDGIGIVDIEDLMTPEEIETTINGLYEKGSTVKPIYSSAEYQNLDVYQVNCTYYSALECNDDSYIAARTIQFFTPGIPQVYYVGLLAGENDIALVEETKNGRDINRHSYPLDEIHDEIQKPVVQRLIKLMEFRNHYPAFDGELTIEDSPENQLILTYSLGQYSCTATIDLVDYSSEIRYFEEKTNKIISFIA